MDYLRLLVLPFLWLIRLLQWLFGSTKKQDNKLETKKVPAPAPFRIDTELAGERSLVFGASFMIPPSRPPILNNARKLKGRDTAVLFLDLSTSMSSQAEQVVKGYSELRAALRRDVYVILCGFNANVWLLYEGLAADMPVYTTGHFTLNSRSCLLSSGTAIYSAICLTELMIPQLVEAKTCSIVWITDGESSHDGHTIDDARRVHHQLASAKIAHRIFGIVGLTSSAKLDRIIRLIEAVKDEEPTERTGGAKQTFSAATEFIQHSMADQPPPQPPEGEDKTQ